VCTAGRECQAISSPAAVHWLCQNARQGAFERPRDHDVVYVLELSAARGDRERKHGGRCRKAANGHDVAIGAAVRSRLRCMALMMVTTFTQATMVALGVASHPVRKSGRHRVVNLCPREPRCGNMSHRLAAVLDLPRAGSSAAVLVEPCDPSRMTMARVPSWLSSGISYLGQNPAMMRSLPSRSSPAYLDLDDPRTG
jgi:hypothetical protein